MQEQAPLSSPHGRYAGFFTRLLAFTIDALIITVVITITSALASFILQTFNAAEVTKIFVGGLLGVVLALFYLSYYLGLWLAAGQTPGKRIMGLRIVRTDGERLRVGNALRRLVGYWLSSFLFLGFLWALVDQRRQGWHDKLAGTIVVYTWAEEEKGETR